MISRHQQSPSPAQPQHFQDHNSIYTKRMSIIAHDSSGPETIPADEYAALADLSSLVRPPLQPRTDRKSLDLIESLTVHADQVQSHTLAAILKTNAHTEYLRKFGLQPGSSDAQSFRSLVPVITYEDLLPDIQRIANGDTSPILTAVPLSEFFTSSGTLGGERKLIPTTHHHYEGGCLLNSFVMPIINQYVPDVDKGKGMYFRFVKSEVVTPGGLLARPALTSFFKSHWFSQSYNLNNVYTSPIETVLCADSFQSMYCQVLCGLLQRANVVRMGSFFASSFLRAIRFFQDHWQQLCHDIRTCNLSDVVTDEPARKAVCQLLTETACPSRQREELAEFIARTCAGCEERGSWKGIIRLVWPHTKYIDVVVTGTMAQYIPTLDMYSGGLPLVSTMYASSECYFGLNLQPMCKPSEVSYTLIPNMAYFEFLPVYGRAGSCVGTSRTAASKKDDQQLVELVDVQVGREYELVLTTFAGLYRYRMGDIVCVTGFHNKAPQVRFVCRKNVALSIDSDKTDEDMLHRAIKQATSKNLDHTSVALVDYTSFVDLSTIPGHYVLFWELQYSCKSGASDHKQLEMGEILKGPVLEQCCLSVEEELDSVYRQCRASDKTIGPLEIRVVKPGSFEALMDYSLTRGASINQYKTPRCIKDASIVKLINSHVSSTHYSPCCPTWLPGTTNFYPAHVHQTPL